MLLVMKLAGSWAFFVKIVSLIFPILLGMVLAFVLSVPMKGFENLFIQVFSKAKKKPNSNLLSVLSLVLTLVCIILVISLAATMVVPRTGEVCAKHLASDPGKTAGMDVLP